MGSSVMAKSAESDASDELTFADLYGDYAGRLRGYALSLARDSDRADDLVQETFIRASVYFGLLAQLNGYQRQAWLNRVLKNLFLDEMRTRRRQEALATRLAVGNQAAAIAARSAYSDIQLVEELLEGAPDHYQEILRQHYFEGLTSEQIGGSLGIPAATVRSRLHLAIKWLRVHREEP
jgi:RNA polymerase sigma-70 factor (ECF subfamily)